jgi:hypothetical protein
MNLIECFSSDLTGDVIRAGSFMSVGELTRERRYALREVLGHDEGKPIPQYGLDAATVLECVVDPVGDPAGDMTLRPNCAG